MEASSQLNPRFSKARNKFQGSDALYHDPVHVRELLMWARAHWQEDHTQPQDLDDLLERAAETLEDCVPSFWKFMTIWLGFLVLIQSFWYMK